MKDSRKQFSDFEYESMNLYVKQTFLKMFRLVV